MVWPRVWLQCTEKGSIWARPCWKRPLKRGKRENGGDAASAWGHQIRLRLDRFAISASARMSNTAKESSLHCRANGISLLSPFVLYLFRVDGGILSPRLGMAFQCVFPYGAG